MARVKKGVNAHKRHKKILKQAKGYYGAKSKVFRAANPAVMRALRSAYVGRKLKKRQYRQMWIARINAAARMNGMSYSRLMDGLKKSGIEINRKMLSEMAIYDAPAFAQLCETAKKHHVLFVPGSSFACPGYVRIAYCVSYDQIKRSLPAFKEIAKEYGLTQ